MRPIEPERSSLAAAARRSALRPTIPTTSKRDLSGAAMASDAFFPFRDGIDTAAEAGIKAVIQPGGSMRDDEVIGAANEHGIAMVFTGYVISGINFGLCSGIVILLMI